MLKKRAEARIAFIEQNKLGETNSIKFIDRI